MALLNIDNLITTASRIRYADTEGENTAERVGSLFVDILNKIKEIIDAEELQTLELKGLIQGTSGSSNSRLDPFKLLGYPESYESLGKGYGSYEDFNDALDGLLYDANVSPGQNYGYFRARVLWRDVEIKNILLSSSQRNMIQVISGTLKVNSDGLVIADDWVYRVLWRQHTNSDGWSTWKEYAGTSSSGGGEVSPELVEQVNANTTNIAQNKSDIDTKVDKVSGKGLSTNDFTTAEKTKLANIADSAEVNVQSDWNDTNTSSDAYIKNKPTFKTINGNPIIGSGDIEIKAADGGITSESDPIFRASAAYGITSENISSWNNKLDKTTADKTYATEEYVDTEVTTLWEALDQKQDKLDDNNIKTINNESILGKGNIEIVAGEVNVQSDWAVSSPTDDAYIKNKPTFKTINSESILGSGDIVVSGGTPAYPLVNHGTGDTDYTLTPNTFHVWGTVAALTLRLGESTQGIVNEYIFQFSCQSIPTTLALPVGIKWATSSPSIQAFNTYQVSIVNNLATIIEFEP